MLLEGGAGFGFIGLSGTLASANLLSTSLGQTQPHFSPRAKRVIFLFMNGAPSHVDTFDPKPALAKYAGQSPQGDLYRKKKNGGFMPSPFKFARHGESGLEMSELFPHLARRADDICILRSMHTDVPNHEPGLLMMHSGNQQPIRPSLGSWASYGLGTENTSLPAFVVLCPGRPVVGPQLWSSGFLPATHQGTSVDTNDMRVEKLVANLKHPDLTRAEQRRRLDFLNAMNQLHLKQRGHDDALEGQIRAMELAFQMQMAASEAFDISSEPELVRAAYGKTTFGQTCLLARRLAERDVRFIQVYYVSNKDKQPWDTHQDNDNRHRKLCADSDRATAALLEDLKQRGLLDETLVIWGGEFGRTPYSEKRDGNKGKPGRDHHHTGFSMFLAGGGVKGGLMYGSTDDFGMHATENRVHVHDLHATILHLMGLSHERLTYHYSGRDFRLTDVYGRVVTDIIA
jgi:hypothetical protein